MEITILIEKAKKIYVSRIDVKGNVRTRDHVIRREMKFNEGDAFSNEKLKRSEQRIRNLGFFETVQAENKQTNKNDRTNVIFNCKWLNPHKNIIHNFLPFLHFFHFSFCSFHFSLCNI